MFSEKLLDLIQEEASQLNLKGATAISRGVRAGLIERKGAGKVPDGRSQVYWASLQHPDFGPPVMEKFEGLPAVVQAMRDAIAFEMTEDQIGAARVGMARKGEWSLDAGPGIVLRIRNTAPTE